MIVLEELRIYTRRRLGGSALTVEINSCDIDAVVEEGMDAINQHLPGRAWDSISASPSQKRYVITQRLIIDIVDVQFMNPLQATGRLAENPFMNANFNMGGNAPGDLTWVPGHTDRRLTEYFMTLATSEDSAKMFSDFPIYETDWEYNESTGDREFVLYLDIPEDLPEYYVSYEYLYRREVSDSNDRGFPTLGPGLENWLKRYTVAGCRELMGDIRNKFHGIPGPETLSAGEVDGADQIQRGREDKERLLDELRGMNRQMPLVIA